MEYTEEYPGIIEYPHNMTTMTTGDLFNYSENTDVCPVVSVWEPPYQLIAVLYLLIFILGLLGNGLVILSMWRIKAKWRTADMYISNLALADLMFVVTLPLWAVHTALGYHWPFGVALCKISSYVVLVNMYASVFCLTCLSFDRYLAIVHSLSSRHLRSREKVIASLGGIWLLSGVLALPDLVFRTIMNDETSQNTPCTMDFTLVAPNERHESSWIVGLSLSSSVLGFLLPFLAMTVFYCFIGSKVTRHFSQGNVDQKKRRLLKIITALVVVFALCWTPFHMLKSINALSYLDIAPTSCSFRQPLLLAHPYATCLAYLNSCLNPFLYAFLDLRFRSQCFCFSD